MRGKEARRRTRDSLLLAYSDHTAMASNAPPADGGAVVEINEPDIKRRRLLDAGGPIEDDETARQKMREAKVGEDGEITGFDPQNVMVVKSLGGLRGRISPMGYFARGGDLPMMRWLYVNGADTRDESVLIYFPMYVAAWNDYTEITEWLFFHGAAKDAVRLASELRISPLQILVGQEFFDHLTRLFILNGALCQDDQASEIDVEKMMQHLTCSTNASFFFGSGMFAEGRQRLLQWSNGLQQERSSFITFLMGTLAHSNSASSVGLLSAQPGICELIGKFVGVIHGREARIVRQLTELLPSVNRELEAVEREEDE